MINEISNTAFQIIFFTLIPFVVFLVKKKTLKGFSDYIGLKATNTKAIQLALLASTLFFIPIVLIVVISPEFNDIIHNPDTMHGKFKDMGLGFKSVFLILMVGVFKTALSEEIFFRGFVAKRLIAITNYKTGNIIQAVIFGIMHTLLFLSITKNPLFLFVIFLFPAFGAYIMVFINEKKSDGSILPSWIMHATANVMSYTIIGFLL